MDEKNEAFQRKFGDKNCGMSSKWKNKKVAQNVYFK